MRIGLGQAIQYRAELAEHVSGRIRAIIAVRDVCRRSAPTRRGRPNSAVRPAGM
jgi:hypothetical protein